MKHGKKYVEVKKLVEKTKFYPLADAIELLRKVNYAKFDAGIELAVKTNANPKYNDQMLRATTILPHGTGKTKKVAVFITEDKKRETLEQILLGMKICLLILKLEKLILMY